MIGLDSFINSVVGIVDKVIPDENKKKELEIRLKNAINTGEISLERIKLESDKLVLEKETLEKEAKLVLWNKLPNTALWWIFVIVIGVNYISSPLIGYFVRMFFYDEIINQGKDVSEIIGFFTPPVIELPQYYWNFMTGLYGIAMTKKGFNRFNNRKI